MAINYIKNANYIHYILLDVYILQVGLKEGLKMTINYFKQEIKKSQKTV